MKGIKMMLAGIASILIAIFFMVAGGTYSPAGMIAVVFLIAGVILVVYGLFAKESIESKGKSDNVAAENNQVNKDKNKN